MMRSAWPSHDARDTRSCVVWPVITELRVSDPSSA
jgi:hypothetical protein